jgi:hypothetical protein
VTKQTDPAKVLFPLVDDPRQFASPAEGRAVMRMLLSGSDARGATVVWGQVAGPACTRPLCAPLSRPLSLSLTFYHHDPDPYRGQPRSRTRPN